MNQDSLIVGLDIGTTKVSAVISEYDDDGRLSIIGVGHAVSHGLRKGIVINIDATIKALGSAVEAAEMMSGREVETVVLSIGGTHIEGLNSKGVVAVSGKEKEISRVDVERVIEAAKAIVIPLDREVFHVIPKEFIVDNQKGIANPLNIIGTRLECEVHIVTGAVTSAQNLLKCVNRASIKAEDLVLSSLAASKAVLTEEEQEMGVLLIDLGGGTTDVLVYCNQSPYHTGVIPIGSEQITSDLSIVLKVPMAVAEKIKIDYGCAFPGLVDEAERVIMPSMGTRPTSYIERQELCQIIYPRVAEMMNLIREHLQQKNCLDKFPGGVVLSGGGALLPGMLEVAEQTFGIHVRIGYPDKIGGLVEDFKSPEFSTSVGLVLYGDELRRLQGQAIRPRKEQKKRFGEVFGNWLKNFI